MADLADDPDRMDELDFMKEQLARLPTRQDQAFTPLRIVVTTAFGSAALVILWFRAVLALLPLTGRS